MVPGIVIESYWWWNDRRAHREALRPARGPLLTPEGEESRAA
jgi:hypothetical protein